MFTLAVCATCRVAKQQLVHEILPMSMQLQNTLHALLIFFIIENHFYNLAGIYLALPTLLNSLKLCPKIQSYDTRTTHSHSSP